jgi:cytoskeletal protein CcmA (bactofilin family)
LTDKKVYRETARMSTIEGDLYIENGRVEAEEDKLIVTGAIRCEHDCELVGDIEATELFSNRGDVLLRGSIKADKIELRHGRLDVSKSVITNEVRVDKSLKVDENLKAGLIRVGGSVNVRGETEAEKARVGGSFSVERDAKIDVLNVGGSCRIEGKATSKLIDVGGSFKAGEVESEEVDSGGSFTAYGPVNLESIRVGGTARVSGGTIRRRIDVGGTFRSNEYLEFGDISVGGTVKLKGGGKGEIIDIGGTLSAEEKLSFTKLDVGGTVKLYGGGEGEELIVGGTMKCRGDLVISDHVKVGGKIAVDGDLSAKSIRVGGKLEADKVVAEQYIETNILYTRNGAKATRIEIERRGKVRGPLIGDIITIKDRASVEDVYAERIQLRRGCRAGNLYGNVVWIDTGCDVDSVTYTDELRADASVRIRSGSQKSEELPEPPI